MKNIITRWHFVRHAPVAGAPGGLYASHDEPADVSDSASFRWLARAVPPAELFLSSGLKRTNATAAAMVAAGYAAPPVETDARFEEQHYGKWYGTASSELPAELRAPPRHKFWFTTATDHPEGGESFTMVAARVAVALDAVTKAHSGKIIVCVAHGGTIRAAIAHALGIDLERALSVSVDNLSVTRIDHMTGPGIGGDWRTVFVNRRPPRRAAGDA